MTAQKHLRDLLTEDQEPFILQNYIADRRRCHFSRRNSAKTTTATSLTAAVVKKLKPTITSSNLCNSVCFSFPESPDLQRSPLPGFAPPCQTAALILEAASRIQKKTDSASAPIKRSLFRSIIGRLTQRNRRRKPEIDVDRRRKPTGGAEKRAYSNGCAGHSRRSSAWWSESNGEWSLGGLEESTSGSDDGADDQRASSVSDGREDWEFDLMDGQLCKSPFISSGHRSPDFSPPVVPSPVRHGKEETRDDYDVDSPKKIEGSDDQQQQEKEQFSPVSILDPAPFELEQEEEAFEVDVDDYEDEDDDYEHDHGHGDVDHDRDRDYDCCYANVQRAKHQLLEKLYRFEKLAELDPIELEKRMSEQDNDDDNDNEDFERRDQEMTVEEFTKEVTKSRFGHMRKIPSDMRNLISDLISEEWGKHDGCSESLMKKVCGKLESWKEVDSDTIDMMVEEDFRRSEVIGGWKKIAQEQVGDIVLQIEVLIFEALAAEFFRM